MKKIIATLILIVALTQITYAQSSLDTKIDEGNELYKNGEQKKALRIWQEVEKKADNPSCRRALTDRLERLGISAMTLANCFDD